jgi:tetratricopeptide (TPR) repeat protein
MIRPLIEFILLLTFSPVFTQGQNNLGSVTVMSGIPNEQLRLEEQSSQLIRQAKELISKGDSVKALEVLKRAHEVSIQHDFLQSRSVRIAQLQGQAYSMEGNIKAAIEAFKERLDLEKQSCDRKDMADPYGVSCGEALVDLGFAELTNGDDKAAYYHLHEAIDCFHIWAEQKIPAASKQVQMFYLYQLAGAKELAGVAKIRLGDRTGGKDLLSSSIEILEKIVSNSNTNPELRTIVTPTLKRAKEELSLLK